MPDTPADPRRPGTPAAILAAVRRLPAILPAPAPRVAASEAGEVFRAFASALEARLAPPARTGASPSGDTGGGAR